jgi:hypothetical protein
MPQQHYTATDPQTGKSVDFDWLDDAEPTDADIEEVFAASRAAGGGEDDAPKPQASHETAAPGSEFEGKGFLEAIRDPAFLKRAAYNASPLPLFEKENLPSTAAGIAGGTAAALTGGLALPVMAAMGAGGLTRGGVSLAEGKGAGEAATDAAVQGGMEGALSMLPAGIGKGMRVAGRIAEKYAPKMILSGLKPVHAYVSRRAKLEGAPLAETAEDMAKFIQDEGLSTVGQASALKEATGDEITALAKTAAEQRRMAPVAAHIRENLKDPFAQIEKFDFPEAPRAQAQARVSELYRDSPLSEASGAAVTNLGPSAPRTPQNTETAMLDVLQRARADAPTINMTGLADVDTTLRPRGRVPQGQFTGQGTTHRTGDTGARQLRELIPVDELLELNRTRSVFNKDTPPAHEMVDKAVELARRNAFKEAVPEAVAPLKRQGRAMDSERLLDRAAWREANRDAVGLLPGASVIGGLLSGNVGVGTVAGLGLSALKNNQIPIGHALGRIGPKLSRTGKGAMKPEYLAEAIRAMLMGGGAFQGEEPE